MFKLEIGIFLDEIVTYLTYRICFQNLIIQQGHVTGSMGALNMALGSLRDFCLTPEVFFHFASRGLPSVGRFAVAL